jgi:hypothetical protein
MAKGVLPPLVLGSHEPTVLIDELHIPIHVVHRTKSGRDNCVIGARPLNSRDPYGLPRLSAITAFRIATAKPHGTPDGV